MSVLQKLSKLGVNKDLDKDNDSAGQENNHHDKENGHLAFDLLVQ
jgi:hypothetical protein